MKKKKRTAKKRAKSKAQSKKPKSRVTPDRTTKAQKPVPVESTLEIHGDVASLKEDIDKMWDEIHRTQERIQDIEIHLNLLTRLLTTLSVEKFGMRVGVLKRIIREIEKEAIRDSQIHHLESLYKLPSRPNKKGNKKDTPRKDDPWEDIS